MRAKTPSEWRYRLGRGSSSSYFGRNPWFIELPRGTAGCLNRKCACFRRNRSCRRATKRPHTLSIAFPPLRASLFRVGGLESLVGCVFDAYLRGGGRGRHEFRGNHSTICGKHSRRHAMPGLSLLYQPTTLYETRSQILVTLTPQLSHALQHRMGPDTAGVGADEAGS